MKCIVMDPGDSVGTVLGQAVPGDTLELEDRASRALGTVTALQAIPFAHKAALRDIPVNGYVFKYGQVIGVATKDIRRGDYVHVQNVKSIAGHGGGA